MRAEDRQHRKRSDQREAAYKCLLLLQKAFPAARWEFITGTRYHEVRDEVEILARNLSGVKRSVHRNFKLEANGALLEFSHEIPAGGDLKGNTIEREIVRAHTAASEHSREVPDIIVRAHLHIYRQMQRKRIIGVVAPCMELQTDFMDRKSTTAMIPDLGMLLLTFDSARRQRGLNPVVVDYIEVEEPSEKIMMVTHAAATGNAEQRKEKRTSWRPSKLMSPPPASRRASPRFEANKNHQARPAKRRVAKFSPSK